MMNRLGWFYGVKRGRGLDARGAASAYRGSQVGTAILLRDMIQYPEKNYTE